MKTKKVIILIIIIIILIVIGLVLIKTPNQNKYQNRIAKTCEQFNKDIKAKEDILLFVYPKDTTAESIETYEKIKKEYSENKIYMIEHTDIKYDCIRKILEKNNLYEDILNNPISTVNLYKTGKYIGQMSGLDSYIQTEEFLIENKILEKQEIEESITYKEYKNNIEKEKYLLLIMADEKMRPTLKTLMEKHFSEYSYNIINMYSEVGEKIKQEIEKEYDIVKEYPRMFYFKDSKMILSEDAFDETTIKEYKKLIDKKENNQ